VVNFSPDGLLGLRHRLGLPASIIPLFNEQQATPAAMMMGSQLMLINPEAMARFLSMGQFS
jgi:hypothetical protein